MATQEDPELTSPHRHTQATAIYETIYSEKKEKKLTTGRVTPAHQVNRENTSKQLGKAETQSLHKAHPQHTVSAQ